MSLVVFSRGFSAALGCHGCGGSSRLRAIRQTHRLRPLRCLFSRYLSTAERGGQQPDQQQQQAEQQQQKSVIFSDRPASQSYANMTPAQKVVEGSKDAGYGLIVLAGALLTGGLFYALWRELFSPRSPSALQTLALERCLADPQVQSALGEPIKCHGEGSSRRSRSRVLTEVSVDESGAEVTWLKFHLVGPFNRADVLAQGYLSDKMSWRLKFLAVEVQQYPKRLIVLERGDNERKVMPPPPPLPIVSDGKGH